MKKASPPRRPAAVEAAPFCPHQWWRLRVHCRSPPSRCHAFVAAKGIGIALQHFTLRQLEEARCRRIKLQCLSLVRECQYISHVAPFWHYIPKFYYYFIYHNNNNNNNNILFFPNIMIICDGLLKYMRLPFSLKIVCEHQLEDQLGMKL